MDVDAVVDSITIECRDTEYAQENYISLRKWFTCLASKVLIGSEVFMN